MLNLTARKYQKFGHFTPINGPNGTRNRRRPVLRRAVSTVHTALPHDPEGQRHAADHQQQHGAAQPPVGAAEAQHGQHPPHLLGRLQPRARVLDDEVRVLAFGAERQLSVDPAATLVLGLPGALHQPLQLHLLRAGETTTAKQRTQPSDAGI